MYSFLGGKFVDEGAFCISFYSFEQQIFPYIFGCWTCGYKLQPMLCNAFNNNNNNKKKPPPILFLILLKKIGDSLGVSLRPILLILKPCNFNFEFFFKLDK